MLLFVKSERAQALPIQRGTILCPCGNITETLNSTPSYGNRSCLSHLETSQDTCICRQTAVWKIRLPFTLTKLGKAGCREAIGSPAPNRAAALPIMLVLNRSFVKRKWWKSDDGMQLSANPLREKFMKY